MALSTTAPETTYSLAKQTSNEDALIQDQISATSNPAHPTDPTTETKSPRPPPSNPKSKQKPSQPPEPPTRTLRHPPYAYIHLGLRTTHPSTPNNTTAQRLDDLTLLTHLSSALTQSFGIAGSAVQIDVLKIEMSEAWIRVPFAEGRVVVAALGGWVGGAGGGQGSVGLRVLGWGSWLAGVMTDRLL